MRGVDDLSGERARALVQQVADQLGLRPSWRGDDAERQFSEAIAELLETQERFENRAVDEAQLKGLSIDEGAAALEIVPSREVLISFVLAARDMLAGAPNYSETPVEVPSSVSLDLGAAGEPERYILTVQRAGRITPHEARQQAEQQIQRVLDLHQPMRIYDACDCHHAETGGEGWVEVDDIGLVCPDGWQYTICRACCTDATGHQTEQCVTEHVHDRDRYCRTVTAMTTGDEALAAGVGG